MSERKEYTTTMDELVDAYTYCIGPDVRQQRRTEALRAIAAHDRALREQIAREIEVEMRRHDNAQIGFSAVGDAYAHAARIARGEKP